MRSLKPSSLRTYFRRAFAEDSRAAFRKWYVLQKHLRDGRERQEASEETARALASDLWNIRGKLVFSSKGEEARFLHNLAVFFGSRGPAENLPRSLFLFEESLSSVDPSSEPDVWARTCHNRGNALQNLARSREDLLEAVECYTRALTVRDGSRRIARGVTLHARGLLFRKLAEAEPAQRLARLAAAISSFEESLLIRSVEKLERGVAETGAALAEARQALSSGC
jgi:tetratricopeptide (TPR) repeat protein